MLQVVLLSPDEVANKAIILLKDIYTNLGPRLQQNQVEIHDDFIQSCVDRLRALYDTVCVLEKDKDSTNRVMQETTRMVRVLTVLREYVAECDEAYTEERSILPLSRYCHIFFFKMGGDMEPLKEGDHWLKGSLILVKKISDDSNVLASMCNYLFFSFHL